MTSSSFFARLLDCFPCADVLIEPVLTNHSRLDAVIDKVRLQINQMSLYSHVPNEEDVRRGLARMGMVDYSAPSDEDPHEMNHELNK